MEYKIPLTKPRLHDFTAKEVEQFFGVLMHIPRVYLEDIVDEVNPDYRLADKDSKKLLDTYIKQRDMRTEAYFDTVKDIQLRYLVSGKPIIVINS